MNKTESDKYDIARKAVMEVNDLRELELLRSIINEMLRLPAYSKRFGQGRG